MIESFQEGIWFYSYNIIRSQVSKNWSSSYGLYCHVMCVTIDGGLDR
jgi:hypothetical protein